MVNWHRKIWVVEPLVNGQPAEDVLFRTGASNEFWLEPVVALTANRLAFLVRYLPGAMEFGWKDWELLPEGSDPFNPLNPPGPNTERLEGRRELEGTERSLKLYVEALAGGGEILHVALGIPASAGEDGHAIAHPR
jgi:hypothetical protein